MTTDEYLALITSEHRGQPKFIATVRALIDPVSRIEDVLAAMREAFDIDEAVGLQLDAVGVRVGISRRVGTPITGVYFSWDSDSEWDGWDAGTWRGEYDPDSGLVDLPDDAYRLVLKAKIGANRWDGTIPGMYDVWEVIFGSFVVVQDHQDMSMTVGIAGQKLTGLLREILLRGYIPLKPEGVRVAYYEIAPDYGSIFAWDAESDALGGWDDAQWAYKIEVI